MAPAPVLYFCADGFCVLLLLFLFLKAKDSPFVANHELFIRVLLVNCVLLLTDTLFALLDELWTGAFVTLDRINCTANFILSGVSGFIWLQYAEAEQGIRLSEKPRHIRLLAAAPMLLLAVLSLCSLKTGWLFTVDRTGFHRGPLYVFQPILAWGYTVFTSAQALVRSMQVKNYAERMHYRLFAWFLIPSFAAGVLRMFITGIPVLCMAITFSLYINTQDQMILRDSLTGLNNRYSLQVHLSEKLEMQHGGAEFFLFLIDADNFKSVNDRFGHAEGDRALCVIAETLKECSGKSNGFAARYGGDEFCPTCELADDATAETFAASIHKRLEKLAQELPYALSVSVGYAAAGCDTTSDELIAAADLKMYQQKTKSLL